MRSLGERAESADRGAARASALVIALVALVGVAVGALGYAAWHARDGGSPSLEEVSEQAVAALVAKGEGVWDNVPDPQVGRVLQPHLRSRQAGGIAIDTNRFGHRERDFAVPKPAGTLRVVLLGDSFVYGNAVAADARLGAVLERELAARAARPHAVECLHIGMLGWNIEAECAYLRRSLDLLEPDLVVHVSVDNDLEDSFDARGFGALAAISSQVRDHADGLVGMRTSQLLLDGAYGLVADGLDWESRARYERAARALRRLADELQSRGCPYLVLFHWPGRQALTRQFLASALAPQQVAWTPTRLDREPEYCVSDIDHHWSPAGHALVARGLYALVHERGLLPALQTGAWDEATATRAEWFDAGAAEAAGPRAPELTERAASALPRIDPAAWTQVSAGQVHAGLDRHGRASPYVSVLLACAPGRALVLRGERAAGGRLGGRARVWVDDHELGTFALGGEREFALRYELPAEIGARAHVTVHVESEDWTYAGDLRRTISFRLTALEIER